MGPAPTTSELGAALDCEETYAAAWSAPPSMSFTQPQGSSAPATLDITYSRNDGAPAAALLGSEPHLQPVKPQAAPRADTKTSKMKDARRLGPGLLPRRNTAQV